MTISSLAKFIVGVNRMIVENVEIETPKDNPTLIIRVRQTKKIHVAAQSVGKSAADMIKEMANDAGVHQISETVREYILSPIRQEFGVENMVSSFRWFHGHGMVQNTPGILKILPFGCLCTCPERLYLNICKLVGTP